jgi:hypothetical protein
MREALWIPSGSVVWALHFAALYGFTALACARGFAGAVPWVAGGATLAALGALTLIAWRHLGRRGEFNAWLTLAVAGLALVAVLYETVPLFIVPICV